MVNRRRRFLFTGAVIVGFFCLLELVLRLLPAAPSHGPDNLAHQLTVVTNAEDYEYLPGTGLFWRPRPGRLLGGTYVINRDGFRGATIAESLPDGPPPPRVKRIVCLGNSATFGWTIADTADTWPAQLQSLLGEGYQVLNLARPGYTSFQGRVMLEELAGRLQPALIIAAFGWNDCLESPLPDNERRGGLVVDRRLAGPLKRLAGLRSYRLLRHLVTWRPPERRYRVPPEEFRENMRAIASLAPAAVFFTEPHTRCVLAECRANIFADRHPQYNEITRGLGEAAMIVDLQRDFEECGAPCLFGGFPVQLREGEVVGGDPLHPNKLGAHLIAGRLKPVVQALLSEPRGE